jgi:head-tail adaptor
MKDVSASEKMRGREVQAEIDTRFTVRLDSVTRTISATDRLVCEGLTYSVVGSREKQRGRWLEVDAVRRSDDVMVAEGSP